MGGRHNLPPFFMVRRMPKTPHVETKIEDKPVATPLPGGTAETVPEAPPVEPKPEGYLDEFGNKDGDVVRYWFKQGVRVVFQPMLLEVLMPGGFWKGQRFAPAMGYPYVVHAAR